MDHVLAILRLGGFHDLLLDRLGFFLGNLLAHVVSDLDHVVPELPLARPHQHFVQLVLMLLQLPPLLNHLKRFSGQLSVCLLGLDPVGLVPQRLTLLTLLDSLSLLNDGLLVKIPDDTLG